MILVDDCPTCSASHVTLDVLSVYVGRGDIQAYRLVQIFVVCRWCRRCATFWGHVLENVVPKLQQLRSDNCLLLEKLDLSASDYFLGIKPATIADLEVVQPPDHLPADIEAIFREMTKAMAVSCFNASAGMARLALDLATRKLISEDVGEPRANHRVRDNLHTRVEWLFENGKMPMTLRKFADQIRIDGNDGVHEGNITSDEAEDLIDFTTLMLETCFTMPARAGVAHDRSQRRKRKAVRQGSPEVAEVPVIMSKSKRRSE